MLARKFWTCLLMGLLVIGIVNGLIANFRAWFIPLTVFGVIFLLWRFPPDRWRAALRTFRLKRASRSRRPRSRKAKFRVIKGSGQTYNGQDESPKYH